MSSISTELGGFTPAIDIVTQDVGLMTSLVYGLVWRHCKMKDGVFKKTVPELAEILGVNERTIRRHLRKLCERGYIKDLTPGLRNRPHVYADTGKVKLIGKVEAILSSGQIGPDLKSDQQSALTLSHPRPDSESGRPGLRVTPALTQSPMSKTGRRFEETGETPAPSHFEELVKKAMIVYSDTAIYKLDKTQVRAITDLIKSEPDFNFTRWVAACTSTKLGGVKPENVQCRIDTYKAGGNYQAMISAKRNGTTDAPPRPVSLGGIDPEAYRAQLEADKAAIAESATRIGAIIDQPASVGMNVEKEIRKATGKRKV
jgi:DNA-binding Lrp family transcriptional regulator